ncbi:hypothetical protein PIIN_01188 [Serendipita indica DSM 11827]|uniref:Uncharacterized protein n=1 Tax=Serendipita indica (strain DSM 11827) TaxID=1109443 RepID=G4T7S1_SERID|nr:hypothetical protein PIIN_01188 [Serendipita indica DSM 11827]
MNPLPVTKWREGSYRPSPGTVIEMSARFSTSIWLLVKLWRLPQSPARAFVLKSLFSWLELTGLPSDLALPMHISGLCQLIVQADRSLLAYPPRFLDFSTDAEGRVKLAHPSLNNSGFYQYHNTLPLEHVQFGFEVYSPLTFFPVKLSNLPPQGVAGAACIPREHSKGISHEPLRSVSPIRDVYVTRYPLNLHASVVSRRDVSPLSIHELQQIKGKRTEGSAP